MAHLYLIWRTPPTPLSAGNSEKGLSTAPGLAQGSPSKPSVLSKYLGKKGEREGSKRKAEGAGSKGMMAEKQLSLGT